jgi:orotate phosphoribosyltransferase
VLIVDDVITAGTAVREAYQVIHGTGADIAGLVISLDRQERGRGTLSTVQELESALSIPVINIIRLGDLIMALEDSGEYGQHLEAVLGYRRQYGVLS